MTTQPKEMPQIFTHGSTWMRADFHLHTRADKEFKYEGESDRFVSDYIAGLKSAGIRIGVIANHNKFDMGEFKELRKKARKEEIYLIPGVELSVNDGSNGIHTLIVFDGDKWMENGNNHISQFINAMFLGKSENEYQNENGRSDKNILQVVEELEKISKDYFLIFAHVEQNSGIWEEMKGGKIKDFASDRYSVVRKRTLGFQKVRTRDDRDKVQRWLGDWYPAEVEGCDCKKIEDIGKGDAGYLKLGAFSFDAVRYALKDYPSRVSSAPFAYTHSHIKKLTFTGGTLDSNIISFSPELNTLIGIRGSGKSSVLEVIRYALDIPFGEKAGDTDYKKKLITYTMGSGGKVELEAVDRHGQPYTIRRILNEPYSEVLINGVMQPGVSIRETVLRKPIYFGQKDLSSTGEGFEKDLVDKLLGSKLNDVRTRIEQQKVKLSDVIDHMQKVENAEELMAEQQRIKQDTEHRLALYAKHGVENKLQKRLEFENDIKAMKRGLAFVDKFISDLEGTLSQNEDDIRNFVGYQSSHNSEIFKRFYKSYQTYIGIIDHIKEWLARQNTEKQALRACGQELVDIRKSMVEEFAEIERQLAEELKSGGTQNISSEEFFSLKKKHATANQLITELDRQKSRKETLHNGLLSELSTLNDLWHEEFRLIKAELDKIQTSGGAISIRCEFKADKQSFLEYMMSVFRGSGIRENTYRQICEKYSDFAAIFKDFENAKKLFGSNPQILSDLFIKNLGNVLSYQTPNQYTIMYRNKELQHHSLGQRASALILFVLSQKENDLIIIDQPEDDLDNQTIYEDVIKMIRETKPNVQFVFATHNPNIPVLGDAETVHACSFADDKVEVASGNIDDRKSQEKIVGIMEGGEEAFRRRKEIYQLWKP